VGYFSGWIVAGLGNPGPRYGSTRHDLGFMLVDLLAREADAAFTSSGGALISRPVRFGGEQALLVKPQEYMNVSGPPIQGLLAKERVPPSRLLVACDDVNLPLGRVRVRESGSAGGHNGLKSIIGCIGDGFPRLRMGVGAQPPGMDLSDWVLQRFPPADRPEVDDMVARAAQIVKTLLADGLATAMRASR